MSEIQASSAVVEAIQQSTDVQKIEVGGETYLSQKVHLPPSEQQVSPLVAHSLSAIAAYVQAEWGDAGDAPPLMVNVISPTCVQLVGDIYGRNSQRHVYLECKCINESSTLERSRFRFDTFQDSETFIIGLLSQFTDAGDRIEVLQLAGNLKGEDVTEVSDDGFSQGVTVRKGVSSVREAEVPSIVHLAPYRTFREVKQPASPFLLRFKKSGDRPQVALFEADGGAWKYSAVIAIVHSLAEPLADLNIPIVY